VFTGIIEELGIVEKVQVSGSSGRLNIRAKRIMEDLKIGDSIAVNGVCLTVADILNSIFTVDVMRETMVRSTLSELRKGSRVNLERAMKLSDRLGGHLVSGHIDGVGVIQSCTICENAKIFKIQAPENIKQYIVEKGSIAVDGISLTVARVKGSLFTVSIIPHTLETTNLFTKRAGDRVNLEADLIAKYLEKLIEPRKKGESHIHF